VPQSGRGARCEARTRPPLLDTFEVLLVLRIALPGLPIDLQNPGQPALYAALGAVVPMTVH
jgi:hypothetical protein